MGLDESAIATAKNYRQQAAALLLYQSVFTSGISTALLSLLDAISTEDQTACLLAYGQWFSALATQQQSWQQHLIAQIVESDNAFAQQAQALPQRSFTDIKTARSQIAGAQIAGAQIAKHISPSLLAAAKYDLSILHSFYQLSADLLSQWVTQVCDRAVPSAAFALSPSSPTPLSFLQTPNWTNATFELANYYRTHGVGIFSQFTAFRWHSPAATPASQLEGISNPDPIRLSQLIAYDHPKQQLIQNTEFLLRGYTAQNVLLYGSRGAGKSSLVKALLNEYHAQGLRLIEVPKAHLQNLPQIIGPLSRVPQKFIIFVDDLSFEDDDENFKALKVVLEGGMTARPQNVVIYATSNRRHLIREFFDERPSPKDADEIQAWDTVQEKLSFSDRFGLTLTVTPADQPTYLTIVRQLAAQASLSLEPENLEWRARQWATRHNGRSGRSARQFVDFLIAEQGDR
ncbi:MAG: ATP-binding protein [Phormidesmis sp.]